MLDLDFLALSLAESMPGFQGELMAMLRWSDTVLLRKCAPMYACWKGCGYIFTTIGCANCGRGENIEQEPSYCSIDSR